MKILYVNPTGVSGSLTAPLEPNGHEVMCVAGPSEALDMIGAGRFSAMLIAEEIEDSEAIEFIYKVHRAQPELLLKSYREMCSTRELERKNEQETGNAARLSGYSRLA